jgi:protein ImuB
MFACLYGISPWLRELAQQFSPLVESITDNAVAFSITGLDRLIGDVHQIASAISHRCAEMGLAANLAIASNRSTAVLAARNITGVTIIPLGKEADSVASLPIEALPATPELHSTLLRWGVETLGDLAALPEIGVFERLGEEGNRLRLLALGQGESILDVRPSPPAYAIRQELEDPIELLEPLLFIVSAQLQELTCKLQRNGQATNRITVNLTHDSGEFRRVLDLPFPMREARALLKQVQLSLEASPPLAATLAVQIILDPAEPRVLQNGLFLPAAPEPEKLHTLLLRLRALAGETRVGSAEILNTHRPDAYRFRPCAFEPSAPKDAARTGLRLAFRYFRPPVLARVILHGGSLRRIVSERVSGEIIKAAGPWRTSGDWWADTSWKRDEWDVVLEDLAVYRIYCAAQQWFLDGSYD